MAITGNYSDNGNAAKEKEDMVSITNKHVDNCDRAIKNINAFMRQIGIDPQDNPQGVVGEKSDVNVKVATPSFNSIWHDLAIWFDTRAESIDKIRSLIDTSLYGIGAEMKRCKKEQAPSSSSTYTGLLCDNAIRFENSINDLVLFVKRLNIDKEAPLAETESSPRDVDRSFMGLWRGIPKRLEISENILMECLDGLDNSIMVLDSPDIIKPSSTGPTTQGKFR